MTNLYDHELSAFQQRYGGGVDNTFPTNEFIENIIKRKSIRRFTDQKIDPLLLEKLFAAAQSSPTSSMFQTWSAVIVESKENREKIFFGSLRNRSIMGLAVDVVKDGKLIKIPEMDNSNYRAVMECDLFIVWCVDLNRIDTVLTDTEVQTIYSTDKTIKSKEAFCYASYEIRSMCDAIIAAQTFCLAAESMGLGTMYCGSVKSLDLTNELELPKKVLPIFGICLGYPQDNLNFVGEKSWIEKTEYSKPRLPQHLVVHKEKYKIADINEIKKYNLLMKNFYHYYGLVKSMDWIERIIVRTQLHNAQEFYIKLVNKYGFWFK